MKTRIASILILAGTITACAGTLQTASISEAYKKYEKDDFKGTLELISRAENAREMFPDQKAEMAYLKALAYEELGEDDLAKALYLYIDEQHPGSQHAYLAREKLDRVQ